MGCVLVTGCSSGIGLETALGFARLGQPVLAGLRNLDRGDELRSRSTGLPVEIVQLDVTDEASIEAATSTAIEQHGAVDVLVNNAGVGAIGSVEDTAPATYRQVFETNVFGLLAMTRAVLPHMRGAGSGVIVNVGSIQGVVPVPFFAAYCASKHAVEAITESLHYEVASFGIRVAVVEPGRIGTSFPENLVHERGIRSEYGPLAKRWFAGWSGIPGREAPATAADVAEAILAAATEPDHPRHRSVGPDAVPLVDAKQTLSEADFERHLRQITGY